MKRDKFYPKWRCPPKKRKKRSAPVLLPLLFHFRSKSSSGKISFSNFFCLLGQMFNLGRVVGLAMLAD